MMYVHLVYPQYYTHVNADGVALTCIYHDSNRRIKVKIPDCISSHERCLIPSHVALSLSRTSIKQEDISWNTALSPGRNIDPCGAMTEWHRQQQNMCVLYSAR